MSFDPQVAISARHLGKAYQLYEGEHQWLKQVVFGSFRTYYKSFWALKDINLEVRHGSSVGILGRNGCGKSTLLQIICGMIRPTKGEIWVKGRVAPILALGATFDLESTGRENVMIGGAVMGLKRAEVLRKFDSIAEFAGIGDFINQPVKLYSTGMRTRLAFAICAHVDADILIVDEALAVGDEAFQRKCLDWIDDFRATGTLLFVSHSMDQVRRLCRSAIWIDDGRVREEGTPDEVIRSYEEVARLEPDNMRRFSAG
jgi:lipopolysaccharide transport system ATP-binding protein